VIDVRLPAFSDCVERPASSFQLIAYAQSAFAGVDDFNKVENARSFTLR